MVTFALEEALEGVPRGTLALVGAGNVDACVRTLVSAGRALVDV